MSEQTTSVSVEEPLDSTPPLETSAAPAPPETPAPVAETPPAGETAAPPQTHIEPAPQPALTQDAFRDLAQVWSEKGQDSPEFTEALQKAGVAPELAQSFIQGQQALRAQQDAQLFQAVGGQEAYQAMAQWASQSLSEEALTAYNSALDSGNAAQAHLAVSGLKAQYEQAVGKTPNLAQAGNPGGDSRAFKSHEEFLDAMQVKDNAGRKRYDHDPAYRDELMRRLEVSNI